MDGGWSSESADSSSDLFLFAETSSTWQRARLKLTFCSGCLSMFTEFAQRVQCDRLEEIDSLVLDLTMNSEARLFFDGCSCSH